MRSALCSSREFDKVTRNPQHATRNILFFYSSIIPGFFLLTAALHHCNTAALYNLKLNTQHFEIASNLPPFSLILAPFDLPLTVFKYLSHVKT